MNVEERYFKWLQSQVDSLSNRNTLRTHHLLTEQLHKKIFRAFVRNDDNRVADGISLRWEFCCEFGYDDDLSIHLEPCSMLEMLVALARRMAYESDGLGRGYEAADWFWRMLKNVGLKEYTDEVYLGDAFFDVQESVDVVLDNVIERRYLPDGHGGLFPLRSSEHDQRQVELWYQMSAYLLENTDLGS